MNDQIGEGAVIVSALLKQFAPCVRESLLDDIRFRDDFNLETQTSINFGIPDVNFIRAELFACVREAKTEKTVAEIKDSNGQIWTLTLELSINNPSHFLLSSGRQQVPMPDLSCLSKDVDVRLSFLDRISKDIHLSRSAQEKWLHILQERALDDDEVDTFHSDLRDSPISVEREIKNLIVSGESNISSLIPHSRRYFERLIGKYNGSNTINEHAKNIWHDIFEELNEWKPSDALLYRLLLSSHSSLTTQIAIDNLSMRELTSTFDYIEKYGDILSCLGAAEIGLRNLRDKPELEPKILRLVQMIRDDNVGDKNSRFRLYSALFVLVDGELAKSRLFTKEPPFYRRLAAMTHAALINRQLIQCGIDIDSFCQKISGMRNETFYVQTFVDMRAEPRWGPEFASPSQFKAEWFGRLLNIGGEVSSSLAQGELREIILGNEERSLSANCRFPHQYYPGPLEGTLDNSSTLPKELAIAIENRLTNQITEAGAFLPLVNLATIFKVESTHADLAARALKLGNYFLLNIKSKSELLAILGGLASVAAVSRSLNLAEELRILVRRYRHDSQYRLSISETFQVALKTCAAQENFTDWREFTGAWLTELAFGDLEEGEATILRSHLLKLLDSVPELWISCAKAEAALKSYV